MPQCNKSSQRNLTYKLQDTILPQGIQYPGQQEKRENAPNWRNYFHHFSSFFLADVASPSNASYATMQ